MLGKLASWGVLLDGGEFRLDDLKLILGSETCTGAASAVALDLQKSVHFLVTTSDGGAYTLADGSAGEVKFVIFKTKATNDAVLTPTTFGPGDTLTFDAAGECAILVCDGTSWQVLGTYGSPTVA